MINTCRETTDELVRALCGKVSSLVGTDILQKRSARNDNRSTVREVSKEKVKEKGKKFSITTRCGSRVKCDDVYPRSEN